MREPELSVVDPTDCAGGAAGAALHDLVGTTLGQGYRVDGMLGQGAMGLVVRAFRADMQRFVAIKLVSKELSGEEQFKQRFMREIKATAALQHPNVVTMYDSGFTEDGQAYFVMEYLQGTDLREVLNAVAPLPWGRVVRLMRQLCAGVGAAHAVGIAHRDLKPENIFVSSVLDQDLVTVTDFGLARLRGQRSHLTQPGTTLGTPDYLAPEAVEAAEPSSHEDFFRADIFAIGCIFFELLTGEVPLRGANVVATLVKRLEGRPPEWSRWSIRHVPTKLRALVEQLLSRAPEDRPADAGAVLMQLDELAQTQDTSAPRPATCVGLGRLDRTPERPQMAVNPANQSAQVVRPRLGRGLLTLPNQNTVVVTVRAVDPTAADLSVFVGKHSLAVGGAVGIAFPTGDASAPTVVLYGVIADTTRQTAGKVDCRWEILPSHAAKFRRLLETRRWE